MSITIETKQNQDGSFSPTTIENQYELKQLVNHGIQLIGVLQIIGNEVVNLTTGLNQAIINNENAIQIYWNTENDRRFIYNNEINKFKTIKEMSVFLKMSNSTLHSKIKKAKTNLLQIGNYTIEITD